MLDAARAEAADEPDVLYDLSRSTRGSASPGRPEEVLEQVLKLDPSHPGAGNDLGYAWAEQGRDLERAESLARRRVKEEPDNAGLLRQPGLGALQARPVRGGPAGAGAGGRPVGAGCFGQRRRRGVCPRSRHGDPIDPLLLDHLGDVMYRLNKPAAAARLWDRSAARLGEAANAAASGSNGAPARGWRVCVGRGGRAARARRPEAACGSGCSKSSGN